MVTIRTIPVRTLAFVVLAVATRAVAQEQPGWTFWFARDGMQESYTRTLGLSQQGLLAIRHGDLKTMDVLDGYSMHALPEPRSISPADFSQITAVYATSMDEAWTVEDGVLKEYRTGQWTVRAKPGPGQRMVTAIPFGAERVIVLFRDSVAEFDARTGAWQPILPNGDAALGQFRKMVRAASGQYWIAAAHGIGRLDPGGAEPWKAYANLEFRDFDYPAPGAGGQVYTVATSRSGGSRTALLFEDGRYRTVFTSARELRAWPGADTDLWVLEGATLWKINGTHKVAVPKRGPLSGVIYDVVPEPDGGFWIGSNTGLAHYAPPTWRTPDAVQSIDQPVHGIAEDPQGRIWFAATEYLLELDGSIWKIHQLPDDLRTQTFLTNSLAALADGRIAFMALESGTVRGHIVTYDPRTGEFRRVNRTELPGTGFLWRRDATTAWVQTDSPCGIATWDGKSLTPRPDIRVNGVCDKLRMVFQASDGAFWTGTTAQGGGVYRPGSQSLESFGKAQGYPEAAVYSYFEPRPGVMMAGGRDVLAEKHGGVWKVLRTGMDAVRSIVESRDKTLWVAAGSGIHRRVGDAWFVNGESDGLPSDTAYVVFEDRQGRIWAGTNRGLSLFDAAANHDLPRAFLANSNASETLPNGNVTFGFWGIDRWKRTPQDRLLFAYRIDGARWSDFTNATAAAFHGLSRGFHTLEVRAMDRNGNIGVPAEFRFRVASPWYLQAGFLASAAFSLVAISALLWFAGHQYRQLVRAKRTAESANRLKSEFLANMSHEIRTPMNAIIGMTELATEIATNEEQKGYLDTVHTSSQSLLSLLNDVLDLSKVESGKLELACEDFDVRLCVEHSIETMQGRADDKKLGLRFEVSSEIPNYLQGDDHRLRQVLLNLLGNAIKFTAKGEVVLRAVLEFKFPETLLLRFTVTDTGAGVPVEKQHVIFAAFEQADASTTRNYGGTGLGLAICTQLARLMHGSVWVESPWKDTVGRTVAGSAFHFTALLGIGKKPVQVRRQLAARPTKALRILIAEDNAVNQLLAVRLVERMGHSVSVAGNGQQAVDVFIRESPDVILMDVQMPVMDGFEATAAIRAREAALGTRTHIIALTAHALQGYREKCLAAGMDSYITKPIRRDDLLRAIEESFPAATPAG